jgi:hypothetical protein
MYSDPMDLLGPMFDLMVGIGVLFIIIGAGVGALIPLNKKMRKKVLKEMGITQ